MTHLVNSLLRPLGWLIVPCNYTRKLFVTWLIAWILIPSAFMIAQTATPESNKQAIDGQNFRLVRLEEKVDNISEAVAAIKFINEKIDQVAATQNFLILSVLSALLLNIFNTFRKPNANSNK